MKKTINWKVLFVLFVASILATIAVLPFALTLQGDAFENLPFSFEVLIILSVVQAAVMFFIAIFLGLYLAKKVGFEVPILERWVEKKPVKPQIKAILISSIGLGVIAGALIIIADILFSLSNESISIEGTGVPIWQGFLASFYGGITEEILLRLFFMSLIVFIFYKIKKTDEEKPTNLSIWVAIIIAAVVFGIGHLPFTASLTAITPLIVVRAIMLNSIGGIIFGWLYWRKGLESAMISHFSTDIVLYVLLPMILILR